MPGGAGRRRPVCWSPSRRPAPIVTGHVVGRSFIQFAEAVAHGNGLDTLALYSHQRIVDDLAFYAALGYAGTGRPVEFGCTRMSLRNTTPAG
jgi:hypothetical protein